MSHDGRFIATTGWDSWVKVRDVSNVLESKLVVERGDFPQQGHMRPIAISPDGRYFATNGRVRTDSGTGGESFDLDLWEVSTGKPVRSFGSLPGQIAQAELNVRVLGQHLGVLGSRFHRLFQVGDRLGGRLGFRR